MFFLNDDLNKDFLSFHKATLQKGSQQLPLSKIQLNFPIQIFLQSIPESFGSGLSQKSSFLQNKLFELLFSLSEINPNLIYSFIQFTSYQSIDIHKVMDSSLSKNLTTLEEFAYKAGRSLVTFKRAFQKTYNTTLHQWILNRRLEYARHLIVAEAVKISEACFDVGFEGVAHFSRVFKDKCKISPSIRKVVEPVKQEA